MSAERPVVALVAGGESGEHDISLLSGAAVWDAIDRERWDPFIVRIERDGAWCFPQSAVDGSAERLSIGEGIQRLMSARPAVVFPAMHGPYGEDGRFQALLELLHLPYVGSGPESSAIAMNKARTRDVLAAAGLTVAPAEELTAGQRPTIEAPCVVKPLRLGSSVGLMVVTEQAALGPALDDAFRHDHRVLIEAFVKGRELTCAVLEDEDGTPRPLPLIEIRPKTRAFFDYHAKYTPGATDEICPAPVDDQLKERVQAMALVAHRALDCRAVSRTDFIAGEDGRLVALETNTMPGLTRQSLLPQAAAQAGIRFPALIDRLLRRALA